MAVRHVILIPAGTSTVEMESGEIVYPENDYLAYATLEKDMYIFIGADGREYIVDAEDVDEVK